MLWPRDVDESGNRGERLLSCDPYRPTLIPRVLGIGRQTIVEQYQATVELEVRPPDLKGLESPIIRSALISSFACPVPAMCRLLQAAKKKSVSSASWKKKKETKVRHGKDGDDE